MVLNGIMAVTEEIDYGFKTLSAQFLAMYPIGKMLITHDWASVSYTWQRSLLEYTVQNPAAVRNPPSSRYRITFLKYVISQLELVGVDVVDELYECFTSLLQNPSPADDFCFKTYVIDEDTCVVLKESMNIVSQGTTGLCTWPASQQLAEFLLEKKELIAGKAVLELGSGLGFLGLVLSKSCFPSKMTISDCHDSVLNHLVENVKMNMTSVCGSSAASSLSNSCNSNSLDVLWSSEATDHVSPVNIVKLDWQHVTSEQLQNLSVHADVVIAADVVYDESIIPHLVRVLSGLLRRPAGSNVRRMPTAIISSTVRNSLTRDKFLTALDDNGLRHLRLPEPSIQVFYYDRTVSIETIEITADIR